MCARGRLLLVVMVVLFWPDLTRAQGPHRDWRTIETPSYRVHYPVEYEAWTLQTARKLESIRTRVAEEVSYNPEQRVDLIVMDPVSQANGFVLPLLGSPRMVLWTSPPPSDSIIGQFRSWPELLVIHEDAHLVHLLRPSRNPVSRFFERTILPVGPITRRAPRWVVEGYATLIEGQLTGSGRPHGDLRAAILRRWAQRGRLPSYDRLAFDPERWQGMSMAYLAGSAYLEWLVDRGGPDSLRHLWARLTARTGRSFDDGFSGVFGEGPEELYGRFTAELTERAMIVERALAPHLRDGELWQRLEWSTGLPAVSPDGNRLAIVLHRRERPARLVVWSTRPDEEREREWQARIDEMLERDPEDVAPVRDRPLPREPVHELPAIDGADAAWPRWMPDGTSILFTRFDADADGFLHPDLFRWHLERGRVERITMLADVRQADPSPDGVWAAAVRHRHGFSQIVRVDLAGGVVTALTGPSVDVVYDAPRISPDGRRLLYLRHAGDDWRAVVRDLESGRERELDTPRAATVTHPAWSRDGATVFLSIGESGFIDIHAFAMDGAVPPSAITRAHGAALGAEPASARALYFLSLEPHGLDLRLIAIETAPPLPAEVTHERLVPAIAPPQHPPAPPQHPSAPREHPSAPPQHLSAPREHPSAPREHPSAPLSTPQHPSAPYPYGFGRQEFTPLAGGLYASSGRLFEIGVRGGDVLGRLNYFAVGSIARREGVAEGAAFAAAWRGWPVAPRAHVFIVDERPSGQPIPVPGLGTALDARRRGLELAVDWQHQRRRRLTIGASAGGLVAQLEPAAASSLSQRTASGELIVRLTPSRGLWNWRYIGHVRLDGGRTGDGTWRRLQSRTEFGLGYHRSTLRFTYDRRHLFGDPSRFDRIQVGGIPGSILPPALAAARVHVPALPLATLIGDRYERQRVEVRAIAPIPIFFERHRVWDQGTTAGQWLRIVGSEIDVATAPIPLAGLPEPVFRFGAARILDPPFGGDNRWWISLSWRP